MFDEGYKMNHSTARNVFVNSMIKIAEKVTQNYGMNLCDKEIKAMAINPEFQEAVSDFIKESKRAFDK